MAFTAGGCFNFITAKGTTSVQEEHYHTVYFASGTAGASGQHCLLRRAPCEKQDVGHEGVALATPEFLAFLPLFNSLVVESSESTRCASTGVTTGCRVLSQCSLIVLFPQANRTF